MAAKLVLALLALAVILSVAVIASFWYFKKRAEYKHEKEMLREEKRAELDEQLVEVAEQESGNSIDAELERERER